MLLLLLGLVLVVLLACQLFGLNNYAITSSGPSWLTWPVAAGAALLIGLVVLVAWPAGIALAGGLVLVAAILEGINVAQGISTVGFTGGWDVIADSVLVLLLLGIGGKLVWDHFKRKK